MVTVNLAVWEECVDVIFQHDLQIVGPCGDIALRDVSHGKGRPLFRGSPRADHRLSAAQDLLLSGSEPQHILGEAFKERLEVVLIIFGDDVDRSLNQFLSFHQIFPLLCGQQFRDHYSITGNFVSSVFSHNS